MREPRRSRVVRDDPLRPPHVEPRPLAELAAAILVQAVEDARDRGGPARRRHGARLFLESDRLEYWLSFLEGIRPADVRRVLEGAPRPT